MFQDCQWRCTRRHCAVSVSCLVARSTVWLSMWPHMYLYRMTAGSSDQVRETTESPDCVVYVCTQHNVAESRWILLAF